MLKSRLSGPLIMRSIPVVGETSITLARSYEGIADFLLLDSHRSSDRQVGALGVTHDWTISRRIVELVRTPVILAGGLGPDNVTQAIRAVRPAGVGSKTKTDQDGSHAKDLARVRRFHEAARSARLAAALEITTRRVCRRASNANPLSVRRPATGYIPRYPLVPARSDQLSSPLSPARSDLAATTRNSTRCAVVRPSPLRR